MAKISVKNIGPIEKGIQGTLLCRPNSPTNFDRTVFMVVSNGDGDLIVINLETGGRWDKTLGDKPEQLEGFELFNGSVTLTN